jgi:hypothetical protein
LKLRNKVAIVFATAALSGTSFVALADNPTQKGGAEQAKQQSNEQARQQNGNAPEVRFGNPSRTIGSDADQAEYDRQDGGIPGVTVAGSRVFEARVSNGATRAVVTTSPNMTRHTGVAMSQTKIYAIYWGSNISSAYKNGVNNFLSALVSSSNNLNNVTTQYTPSSTPNVSTFSNVVALADTSNPPGSAPTTSSILAEAYKIAKLNNVTVDSNSLFMVFTNNYPARAGYCAWHGAGSVSGSATFTVAYQPYLANNSGCPALTTTIGVYQNSADGISAVANVASHEIYETITDPFLNAWYDSAGAEIGDKCAWTHGVAALGGYYVQTEWSNITSTCVAKV